MLPPVVLIDLEPEPGAAAAALLSQRCTQVVASAGTGGCALDPPAGEQDGLSGPDAPWLVQVNWSGDPMQSAQIVLFRSNDPLLPVRRRELSFSLDSPELDRWESVGLLVAALVVSARAEPAPTVEPIAEPEPQPQPAPTPLAPQSKERPEAVVRGYLGAAGMFGSALKQSPGQFGASLQGALAFPEIVIRPLVQLGYSHASADPELHHGWLGLGAGLPFISDPFELELYLAMLGQLMHARAGSGAATDSATRLRWGGALGLGAYPELSSSFSIWLAAEGVVMMPKVAFEVQNVPSGELHPFGWRGFLGLRWTP